MRLSLLVFLFPLGAHALDLRSQLNSQSNLLTAAGEMSTFTLDEGKIEGQGAKIDFYHSTSSKVGVELFVSSALSGGQSVSSSFTGLGGYALYNVLTECCAQTRTAMLNGVPVVTDAQPANHLFQVGLGLNQYFLNGSRGVYSLSGPGFAANYLFRVYGWQLKSSIRTAQLVSNQTKVQGVSLSIGLVFPL